MMHPAGTRVSQWLLAIGITAALVLLFVGSQPDAASADHNGNHAPVAEDDNATTGEDTPVEIDVIANDTDDDVGDTLWVTNASSTVDGTVTINASGTITYLPNAGFTGIDSFTYVVSDGSGGEDTGTVEVTVNDPPDCSNATPSIEVIDQNNKKFVPVTLVGATDPNGHNVTSTVFSIWQDESVGTGQHAPDGMGIGTDTALVRAQRDGNGTGRFYGITFEVTDGFASSLCVEFVEVVVPKGNKEPFNEGPLCDSTLVDCVVPEPPTL
ncbi:MAG: hypothetical protein FI707_17505 [SAR202 cluster bacterium]|nr:Ig-like domain-containing protein [SAR202 cluster bacterium]MQG70562.1 hypothetical protein [SAR202 cluster bacterium]